MKFKKFETKRLFLVPTSMEDAEFILELLNTPKWLQYIGDRNVNSIDDAKIYIADKIIPQFVKLGYGNYTVIKKTDNTKIGSCGLFDRDGLDGVDIGFGFLPEYEKNGYALESAIKIKELAFNSFSLELISAITNKDNVSSQKLLTKLGLQFVKYIKLPTATEQLMLYQLKNTLA